MKQFIKTLLLGLFLGVAFVSCNNDFEKQGTIVYPTSPSLGIYKNYYTAEGATSYTVNLTINEAGDTICDVTTLNTKYNDANVFSAGKLSYDSTIGMMTADYENTPYETPGRVTIAYKRDGTLIVTLYSLDGENYKVRASFNAVKTDFISYFGEWQLPDGNVIALNADGSAELISGGEILAKGKHEIAGNKVNATVGDKTYAFETNANGQTYVTVDGQTSYVSHTTTQPKEDWYEYALGSYSSWLFNEGAPMQEVSLEYSPSRRMARIQPWINDGTYFSFYWVIGEPTATVAEAQFSTGYEHSQQGQYFGLVYGVAKATGTFANNTFTFLMGYEIPGVATFGEPQNDSFVIRTILE